MVIKKTPLFASLLCVLISTVALGVGGNMGGTDPNGSPEKPYLIEDLADFDTFADSNNAATYWAAGVHTKLMTNIDLSGRTYTTAVIAPDIDSANDIFDGTTFRGNFNGNRHKIISLSINTGIMNSYIGLFGQIVYGAVIYDLGIENCDITGGRVYVGALLGSNGDQDTTLGGSMENCYSSGSTSSNYYVGGLVGANYSGNIMYCHAIGNVSGSALIGGLVGNNEGNVASCYATVVVSGTDYDVGGLAGKNEGNITNSCATGVVRSTGNWVASLVGWNKGSITNCYSGGSVSGDYCVGGLAGINYSGSSIANSYTTSVVSGNGYVGGLCGKNDTATVTSSYFLEDAGIDNGYGTPLTDSLMKQRSTFIGWDFSDGGDPADWMMLRPGEDYPRLAWQEVFAGDIAGLYGADMVDFSYLARYWGLDGCNTGTDCGRADIDISGDVGLSDLAAVANDWLK